MKKILLTTLVALLMMGLFYTVANARIQTTIKNEGNGAKATFTSSGWTTYYSGGVDRGSAKFTLEDGFMVALNQESITIFTRRHQYGTNESVRGSYRRTGFWGVTYNDMEHFY